MSTLVLGDSLVRRVGEYANSTSGTRRCGYTYQGYGGYTCDRLRAKLVAALRVGASRYIIHAGGNDLDSGLTGVQVFQRI